MFTWYDPNTDTINAEPNTLAYFHEEGHQQQHKSGLITTFQMWSWYSMMGAIWFLAFDRNIYSRILIIISVFLVLYLEIDAWSYAIKKWKTKY